MADQWLLTLAEMSAAHNGRRAIAQAQLVKAEPLIRQAERTKVLKEIADMLEQKDWFGEKLNANERLKVLDYIRNYKGWMPKGTVV